MNNRDSIKRAILNVGKKFSSRQRFDIQLSLFHVLDKWELAEEFGDFKTIEFCKANLKCRLSLLKGMKFYPIPHVLNQLDGESQKEWIIRMYRNSGYFYSTDKGVEVDEKSKKVDSATARGRMREMIKKQ